MVTASDFLEGQSLDPLREETVRAIEMTPGVTSVFRHFATDALFRGENIRLSANSAGVWADRVGFDLIERSGTDRAMVTALQGGAVFVYDAFQRHFRVSVGDSIRLDTPQGPHDFPIVGVRRTYVPSSTGGIQMDLSTFDRYWERPGLTNLIIWTTGDEQTVLDDVQRAAGNLQPLFFVNSAAMDRMMQSNLDEYRVPILALLALILVLAGAAVANLMAGSSSERRGDISLLQCVGASRRQLLGLTLLESSFVGATGALAGLALGVACAVPVRAVVEEQLGWLISWRIRPMELLLLVLGTIGISVVIGVITGLLARRAASWNSLAPE
jgi:putative ABC transport system permease protein